MISKILSNFCLRRNYWLTSYCVCVYQSLGCIPILGDPMDCTPPGSSVRGILQTRILEWVAIPFSRGSSRTRDRTLASCTAGRLPYEPPGKPHLFLIYLGLKGMQSWSTIEFLSLSNIDILSLINASHLPHTSCDNQNVTKCPLREGCKVSTWKPLIWNDRW